MKLFLALLVAVLVACTSAKSVRPLSKALLKKALQNRLESSRDGTGEEPMAKLTEKLAKWGWGPVGYGTVPFYCTPVYAAMPYYADMQDQCKRLLKKDALMTRFGNDDGAYDAAHNTGYGGGYGLMGYGADPNAWNCAWYPYDCEKCPKPENCGTESGSGSDYSGSDYSKSDYSGSGTKEASSAKFGNDDAAYGAALSGPHGGAGSGMVWINGVYKKSPDAKFGNDDAAYGAALSGPHGGDGSGMVWINGVYKKTPVAKFGNDDSAYGAALNGPHEISGSGEAWVNGVYKEEAEKDAATKFGNDDSAYGAALNGAHEADGSGVWINGVYPGKDGEKKVDSLRENKLSKLSNEKLAALKELAEFLLDEE